MKLNAELLKLVRQFALFSSSISSTESDVNINIGKTWTAPDRFGGGVLVM